MVRPPEPRWLLERPDRPGGRLDPDVPDHGLPEDSRTGDWDSALEAALDSFDSEDPSSSPVVARPEASLSPARPPAAQVGLTPITPRPAPVPTTRDLFTTAAEPEGGNRLSAVASGIAALWRGCLSALATVGRTLKASLTAISRSQGPGPRTAGATSRPHRVALLATLLVTASALLLAAWSFREKSDPTAGSLTVTSKPAGAPIVVDGQLHGNTPATLSIAAGLHTIEVRSPGPAHIASVRVGAGERLSRFFELAAGTSGASLQVTTKPAGATVTIDGRPRGRTPVTVSDLNPGAHRVGVRRAAQSAERLILLESGANGTVNIPLDPLAASPTEGHGWLDASVAVEARATEGGRTVGSTRAGPWQLTAGRHELTFVNQDLGFQHTAAVDIVAGRIATLAVPAEPGQLSVTAIPAATILIDGEPLGAAPIVQRPLAAGQHDLIARHPVLGERRLLVTVTPGNPLALTIDLRR